MAHINLKDAEQARMQITKEQEKAISEMYHKIYLDYKKQMKSLPLQGQGTVTQSLKRFYLNKLTKQLKEAYESLGKDLEKQITQGMENTSQAMVSNINDWLKEVGLSMEGAYSYVPKDIVARLSTGQVYGDGWTLSKAIWGESQKHTDDINKVVANGVAANKSAYDIAKDLEQYVNPSAKKEWSWSKVYPGTSKKIDYNAQRLARTMVSHAYQQSLLATTKYNPFVSGYRWRSAHTHRTCELCNERDGKVFSAEDLPLDHPNGLCTFIAELTGDMNSVADRLADWANGKEDLALDKWYNDMGGKPLDKKVSSIDKQLAGSKTPPISKWIDILRGYSQEDMLGLENQLLGNLDELQKKAIRSYTGAGFEYMNSYLRAVANGMSKERAIDFSDISEGQLKQLERIREVLRKVKIKNPLILRRGSGLGDLAGFMPGDYRKNKLSLVNKSASELNDTFSGLIGEYSSFVSTSCLWDRGFSDSIETIIYAPPGSQVSPIMGISRHGVEEGEALINAGTRVKILSVEESDGHFGSSIRVFMEIIPGGT